MKRRIISLFLSIITILSVCSMFAISAYATATYNGQTGYTETWTKTISAAGKNTKIGHLNKCFTNKVYSKAAILKSDSNGKKTTVNKMSFWVMNADEKWMSEKYTAYPTGQTCTIYYYSNVTFVKGKPVYLWGEQANIKKKTAVVKFFSY